MSFFLLSISETIGRLHPVLVHLPIGVLLITVLLHWLSDDPKYGVSVQVVRLLYGIGIGGALLSAVTGFLLSNSGEYEDGPVALHMWLGILTTVLSLLAFARFAQQQKDAKWLSLLLLLALLFTGHFGGLLSHGSGYFSAAASAQKEHAGRTAPLMQKQTPAAAKGRDTVQTKR